MEIRVFAKIESLPREEWDALLDAEATPFVSWTFLHALEAAGCAAPRWGWQARHLTLWQGGRLIAAAPAYAKANHEGDFARDWSFADYAGRLGVRYNPRLLVTVPITPVTGRRILVAPGEDRGAATAALMAGARELCVEEEYSSLHVLFPLPDEVPFLEAAGLASRIDYQAHWKNRGFAEPAAWLASLDAKKRYQARKERAAPVAQGINLRTVRGEELAAERERWGRDVHALYRATLDKLMWGRPWLNGPFFDMIFREMPEHLEVVEARREGRLIAGAFNVQAGVRLYGRYWGCHEEHRYLHFNVCLHHSIDDCIRRGLQVFEGGAGGEHKVHRGFDIAATHSAHAFLHPRLDADIRRYLALERKAREEAF